MKFNFYFFLSVIIFTANSQNILIGHMKYADKPVSGVSIEIVPQKGSPFRQFTGNESDFQLILPFQNTYFIHFSHPDFISSFIMVDTHVPEDKTSYRMITEFEIIFYNKNDEDVQKEVFKEPYQKFYFNGINKIVNDTVWLKGFYKRLMKKNVETQMIYEPNAARIPVNICGRFLLENNASLPILLEEVSILDRTGKIIRKSRINRFGELVMTGLFAEELFSIRLEVKKGLTGNKSVYLKNSDSTLSKMATPQNDGSYLWTLSPEEWKKLMCATPEYFIGGKIILTTKKSKDFFSNKNVYLCNQFNTVIKTTKTNQLGMFAFEDIKPDQTYYIGIDTNGVSKTDRIDLLNKEDRFVGKIDSMAGKRFILRFKTDGNDAHQLMLLSEKDLRMDIRAKIYQKNPGQALDARVTVMNEKYKPIDSVKVNTVGDFTFKYLPFFKRFYLEFEPENDAQLEQLSQLLLYGKEGEFIKAFTNLKGNKFVYKPIAPEITKMRDVNLEDPWLELSLGNRSKDHAHQAPPVISEKILFDFNKYEIQEQSKDVLNKIAFVLKENPNFKLIISAHTDCIGNAKDNLELSRKRAEAVKNYLVHKGVAATRLQTKGYGEEKPLNHCTDGTNCSEMEHAVNRRVEFTILNN
ncbi:MAG: OmpA family protein [Bacteroidia bacterium]|nr:OmpA family protein [Bacteroidia bacterium]